MRLKDHIGFLAFLISFTFVMCGVAVFVTDTYKPFVATFAVLSAMYIVYKRY